jgi:hypothetical protein
LALLAASGSTGFSLPTVIETALARHVQFAACAPALGSRTAIAATAAAKRTDLRTM